MPISRLKWYNHSRAITKGVHPWQVLEKVWLCPWQWLWRIRHKQWMETVRAQQWQWQPNLRWLALFLVCGLILRRRVPLRRRCFGGNVARLLYRLTALGKYPLFQKKRYQSGLRSGLDISESDCYDGCMRHLRVTYCMSTVLELHKISIRMTLKHWSITAITMTQTL